MITCGGWTITKESVDALIPVLQAKLSELDPSVPVILWCLDSACFRALSSDGDLKNICKSATDGKYHVSGELMVTPFSLLSNTLREIDRIVTVCREHKVWVMVSTVDLLTGVHSAAAEVQMDGLYEFWSNDPVHGDKIAYPKIALGLLDLLDRKLPEGDLHFNLSSRKRGRDSSMDRISGNRSDRDSANYNGFDRDLSGSFRSDRDPSNTRSSRSDRDHATARSSSSYRTYPGDFPPGRDRFRRQSGPGPRRDF
jgi:hypothetical protein